MSGAKEQGLILFHSGLLKHNVEEWTLNKKSEDLSSHSSLTVMQMHDLEQTLPLLEPQIPHLLIEWIEKKKKQTLK